jgi:hypothetical protein
LKVQLDPKKTLAAAMTALVLLFAGWLVSPFFRLTAATEQHGRLNTYRLFLGLMIMIGFVGKSLWDVLAPQGLARKVSSAKAAVLVALIIIVLGFIVFTIARALSMYLDSSIAIDAANYLP